MALSVKLMKKLMNNWCQLISIVDKLMINWWKFTSINHQFDLPTLYIKLNTIWCLLDINLMVNWSTIAINWCINPSIDTSIDTIIIKLTGWYVYQLTSIDINLYCQLCAQVNRLSTNFCGLCPCTPKLKYCASAEEK